MTWNYDVPELPQDSGGLHYPEAFTEIVYSDGTVVRQSATAPEFSGSPFGAKRIDLIWLDSEAWARVDPWPPWCGDRPFYIRAGGLHSFIPAEVPSPERPRDPRFCEHTEEEHRTTATMCDGFKQGQGPRS